MNGPVNQAGAHAQTDVWVGIRKSLTEHASHALADFVCEEKEHSTATKVVITTFFYYFVSLLIY